jgi:hypothetical protein
VAGIGHYGNCVGVPNVGGECAFDEAYAQNPLVNAMCVGLLPTERVLSAKAQTGGSNPNFDTISFNSAFRNHPADLIWDHTGVGVRFRHNACRTSIPDGFCH